MQINPQQICLGLSILLFVLLIFFQSRRAAMRQDFYFKKAPEGTGMYHSNLNSQIDSLSKTPKESFEENIYSKNKLGQKTIHGSSVYFNNPYPPALEQGFLSITKL